jgi:hypothetical protein
MGPAVAYILAIQSTKAFKVMRGSILIIRAAAIALNLLPRNFEILGAARRTLPTCVGDARDTPAAIFIDQADEVASTMIQLAILVGCVTSPNDRYIVIDTNERIFHPLFKSIVATGGGDQPVTQVS